MLFFKKYFNTESICIIFTENFELMKNLIPFLVMLFAVVACQQDPQKKAGKIADDLENKAEHAADKAKEAYDETVDKASEAISNKTMAELNQALASVEVPEFSDNVQASELVKKIGNDGIDYVNAKSAEEAGKYVDQMRENFGKIDQLQADGKITASQADQIRSYAEKLADAVSVNITEVDVVVPAN